MWANLANGIHELNYQHIDQVAALSAQGFLTHNPIWSKADLKLDFLVDFFKKQIREHLEAQERTRKSTNTNIILNFIIIKNHEIVGAGMHYDMHEYRHHLNNNEPSQVQLFQALQQQGKQLVKAIDMNELQNQKCLYASWGMTKHTWKSPGQKLQAMVRIYSALKGQGFGKMIGRASNQKTAGMYIHLGGHVLTKKIFQFNQHTSDLFFLEILFDNPTFSAIEQKTLLSKQIMK